MWKQTFAYFCSFYSFLYNIFVPCSLPEQLPANTINHQQYLGKWYFKAAVSFRDAHIEGFKALDSGWFTMEETDKDTLLLTGHMRMGQNCINQSWTYHIHPDRDDLELEGRPKRHTLLWSGKWANCPECIILQEIEPPLTEMDSEDSLGRHMLYTRQKEVDPEVVATFLKNAACHRQSMHSFQLPEEKELCP